MPSGGGGGGGMQMEITSKSVGIFGHELHYKSDLNSKPVLV